MALRNLTLWRAICALFALACLSAPLRANEPVDLELVLAVDVSGSVDRDEARLQREGYLRALVHPKVIQAIQGGMLRRIAVTYVEWAGMGHYKTVVDWSVIQDKASAEDFVAKLRSAPIETAHRTSISEAIERSIPRFAANAYVGTRRILDISGDGANNYGNIVTEARDMAVKAGITINGLPILSDQSGALYPTIPKLDLFYRDCVIGGPGAFHIVANGFADFAQAIRRKLILEIAGLDHRRPAARGAAFPAGRRGRGAPDWRIWRVSERESPPCTVGEWRWMSIIQGE
jgi:hypothetical protein